MAPAYYVYSGAVGSADGSSWANAYTSILSAIARPIVAGDDLWVAHDNAESGAVSTTYTLPGTIAAPNRIICVNRAGSVPPVSADLQTRAGSVTTTGNTNISFGAGYGYWSGLNFSAGTSGANVLSVNSANLSQHRFVHCKLKNGSSSTSARIGFGNGTINNTVGPAILDDTQIEFANASQGILIKNSHLQWRNTASALQGTIPTTLFLGNTTEAPDTILLEGVDLSGTTGTIFGVMTTAVQAFIKNCKLGVAATLSATQTAPGCDIWCLNSDDATSGKGNRTERHNLRGDLTTNRVNVVTSGATPASDGVEPISYKVVTTANANRMFAFELPPIEIWNDTTGSPVTLTFEIMNDGTTLKNTDIWGVCQYLSDSTDPLVAVAASGLGVGVDILNAGTNLGAGSATWDYTGISAHVNQKIVLTFTPQKKGYVHVTLRIGKASQTLFINPNPAVS